MENILGGRIRSLRTDAGMEQVEFAKRMNLARSTVSQYETGARVPDDETKSKIADMFNVSVDYLLGRTDDPTPPGQWVDPPIRDDDEEIRLDEIGYALYGESQELSENDKLVLLDMAKALRARAKEREGKQ